MNTSMSYDKNFNARVKKRLKGHITRSDRMVIEEYAKEGVRALSDATPNRTGLTASSWYYEIIEEDGKTTVSWCNNHVEDGVNIAVVLDSGHASRSGSWINGTNYINTAISPIIEKIYNYLNNK